MGISISYLQRISGKTSPPDDPNLKGISRIFNTSTTRGRANISILMISFYTAGIMYYVLKKKGNADEPSKTK